MPRPFLILGGKSECETPADYKDDSLCAFYKPLSIHIGNRNILRHNLDVITSIKGVEGNEFDPIYIAGPENKYWRYATPYNGSQVAIIDTDGRLDENLRNIGKQLRRHHGNELAVIMAGDVLPSTEDLGKMVNVLRATDERIDAMLPVIDPSAMRTLGFEKRNYTLQQDTGDDFNYVWGQIYALRPQEFRWDIAQAAAGTIYARRTKGFKQKLQNVPTVANFLARVVRPRNIGIVPFILRNIIKYVGQVKEGNLSVGEGERGIEKVLLRKRLRRPRDPRALIWHTDCATLGADIDGKEELAARAAAVGEEWEIRQI